VRRQDDGEWVFGDGGHDRCHHLVPGQRVQVRQRFIQQQQFRAFGQSQGQRNLGVLPPDSFPIRRSNAMFSPASRRRAASSSQEGLSRWPSFNTTVDTSDPPCWVLPATIILLGRWNWWAAAGDPAAGGHRLRPNPTTVSRDASASRLTVASINSGRAQWCGRRRPPRVRAGRWSAAHRGRPGYGWHERARDGRCSLVTRRSARHGSG